MIELARQDAMTPRMARQKHHVTAGESAGEKRIRRRAKRCSDPHPLLVGKTFQFIQSASADNSDPMRLLHRERILLRRVSDASEMLRRHNRGLARWRPSDLSFSLFYGFSTLKPRC